MDLEKTSSADRFISAMAEKLGAVAQASTVFGEPVERDGITVIPVAKARWGFGSGAGQRKDHEGSADHLVEARPRSSRTLRNTCFRPVGIPGFPMPRYFAKTLLFLTGRQDERKHLCRSVQKQFCLRV
jgi:hypothetical protein